MRKRSSAWHWIRNSAARSARDVYGYSGGHSGVRRRKRAGLSLHARARPWRGVPGSPGTFCASGTAGFTSAHVVTNVAHRIMTLEAVARFGWPTGGIAQRLQRHPGGAVPLMPPRRAVSLSGKRLL